MSFTGEMEYQEILYIDMMKIQEFLHGLDKDNFVIVNIMYDQYSRVSYHGIVNCQFFTFENRVKF